MEIKVWVCTNRVGSKCERNVQIDDEDFEGMDEQEKEIYIENYCQDELWDMIEWGWTEE